ncbi:MAG TPA: hypothetical protein PLU53_15185, partial [Bacteroidia bacterium]|nr:hypothetical protein [Bacteroidia bacterium]
MKPTHPKKQTIVVVALFTVLNFIFSSGLSAQQMVSDLWKVKSVTAIKQQELRETTPEKFSVYELDLTAVKAKLNQAPMEGTVTHAGSSTILEVPLPDGSISRFRMLETPVMEAGLAKQYPFIRTFTGQGIEDPTAILKADYTLFGFHAMIMSVHGWFFIEPYILGNTSDYICYDKKYSSHDPNWICETDPLTPNQTLQNPVQNSVYRTNGTQLRTYRLALACTGEYAAFYGGTKAGALSGMVTSVNRVTGVY